MADKRFAFPGFLGNGGGGAVGWAVIGIFLILAFAAIAAGRDFLMPVTLAILLFFVFTPARRLARRRRIPDGLTAAVLTLSLVVAVALFAYAAVGPINQAVENMPLIESRLEQKLDNLRQSLSSLREAAEKIGDSQAADAGGAPAPVVVVEDTAANPLATAMRWTPTIVGQVVFTLFLLFFMLAAGDLLYLKIVQSFDTMHEKRNAYLALRQIEDSLGNYLGAITVINAGLGVVIGLAMYAWGLPGAILFGLSGFVLNYIPFLGAIAGVVLSGVVALVVMPGVVGPMLVAATYLALTSIEGQFITPYFVSKRLQMNTVVVFLAVALWAWLWSVIGMIIAVPVLVVMRVLADYVPGWEKFGNFLAGEAPPAIEDEDEEEARDLVEAGAEAEDEPAAAAVTAGVVAESAPAR